MKESERKQMAAELKQSVLRMRSELAEMKAAGEKTGPLEKKIEKLIREYGLDQ